MASSADDVDPATDAPHGEGEAKGGQDPRHPLRTRVVVESPTHVGRLATTEILWVVRRRSSALRRCYDRELDGSPGLQGRVLARFRVQPDGSVLWHASPGVFESASFASCLATKFSEMKFRPTGEASQFVEVPMTFSFDPPRIAGRTANEARVDDVLAVLRTRNVDPRITKRESGLTSIAVTWTGSPLVILFVSRAGASQLSAAQVERLGAIAARFEADGAIVAAEGDRDTAREAIRALAT